MLCPINASRCARVNESNVTEWCFCCKECHIDLQKIARFANANLVHTEAIGIDTVKRLVHCKDGRPPIRYDVLSIDIGSTPKFVETQVSRLCSNGMTLCD